MTGQVSGRETAASNKLRLVKDLLGPYHRWVMVILAAMLVETAMSLAGGPWPLKIILDNVVGSHKPPGWLDALRFIDLCASSTWAVTRWNSPPSPGRPCW